MGIEQVLPIKQIRGKYPKILKFSNLCYFDVNLKKDINPFKKCA